MIPSFSSEPSTSTQSNQSTSSLPASCHQHQHHQQPSRDEMKEALNCQHHKHLKASLSTPPLSKRQAAYEAALYYGECGLKRIPCTDAQEEALKACDTYDTYWVHNMHNGRTTQQLKDEKHSNTKEKNGENGNVDRRTGWRDFLERFSNSFFFKGSNQQSNVDTDSAATAKKYDVPSAKPKSNNANSGHDHQQKRRKHQLNQPYTIASKRKSSEIVTNDCCSDDKNHHLSETNRAESHSVTDKPYIVRDFDSSSASTKNIVAKATPLASPPPTAMSPTTVSTANNDLPFPETPILLPPTRHEIENAKNALITTLRRCNGDVTTPESLQTLHALSNLYQRQIKCYKSIRHYNSIPSTSGHYGFHHRQKRSFLLHLQDYSRLDGRWLTLSKPEYHSNKGICHRSCSDQTDKMMKKQERKEEVKETLYTLGRMSFGMFHPSDLLCTIQGIYNTVHACRASDDDEEEIDDNDNVDDEKMRRKKRRRRKQQQRKWMDHAESCNLPEHVPACLREEIRQKDLKRKGVIRSYNIVTAFTIEPNNEKTKSSSSPSSATPSGSNTKVDRPIRGIMTTYGYAIPDPTVPRRLSIWFTGGTLEVNDEAADVDEWRRIFRRSGDDQQKSDSSTGGTAASSATQDGNKKDSPSSTAATTKTISDGNQVTLKEKARLLAARVFLGARLSDGMDVDGTMSYHLNRPVGGHGRAFCDVLFLDETLRVMKGHHGSIYVFARVPSFPAAC